MQQNSGMSGDVNNNRRNPADNLSREDRVRGGERSSSSQNRANNGRFNGRKAPPAPPNPYGPVGHGG